MPKYKVLIVEDNRPISKAMKIELKTHGFAPSQAFDGKEALEMVKKEKFDLLLVDLIMPKVDGYTFIEEVKKLGIRTPIIVVSNINVEDGQKCEFKLGVDACFVKSNVSLEDIIKKTNEILKK